MSRAALASLLAQIFAAALGACNPGTIGDLYDAAQNAGTSHKSAHPTAGDLPPGGAADTTCRVAWSMVPTSVGQLDAPTMSVDHGFFDAAFELVIESTEPDSDIVYTTDGSTPTETQGERETSPVRLSITTTTVVRARAVAAGMTPSQVTTRTYLFPDDVLRQAGSQAGYPHPELDVGNGDSIPLDFEMDPEVVGDPRYRERMRNALLAIPTVVLSAAPGDFFGSEGIYVNGGSGENSEWEIAASMELIDARDPLKGGQIDCALRPHTHVLLKRSFKLLFKDEYGPGKLRACLFRDAPQNGASATVKLDRIILRGGTNRSWWSYWNPDDSTYTRDQWARDSQIAMSGEGVHGTFVHLYLNSLYFGVYNAAERPDTWFASEYFGGDEEGWFAVNHGGPVSGDPVRWTYLTTTLVNRDLSLATNYDEVQQYLDVEQYADYLILNWYAGNDDWPGNNWYAAGRVTPPGPMRFFVWDAEDIWDGEGSSGPYDQPGGRGNDGAWVYPVFRQGASSSAPIAKLWHALRVNDDFITTFADRVHQHCSGDGALVTSRAQERWRSLGEFVREAMLGEAARWGDARESLGEPLRTPEDSWDPEYERVMSESMPGNCDRLVAALRDEGYYPKLDPPVLDPPESHLAAGSTVTLMEAEPDAAVYFTLDGSDPRRPGGTLAPGARAYDGAVVLPAGATLVARALEGDTWSARTVTRASPP